jgi:hypothetical protein
MRVDVHLRWHVLTTQRADKDPSALADADPDRAGHQIDNLGYPGYAASGRAVQAGVTLTVPLLPRSAEDR